MVTYAWDVGGALTSVAHPGDATVSYVLDAQGRWIGRKVGGVLERGWLYVGPQPIAEVSGDGHTVTRVFVYGSAGHVPDAVLVRPTGATGDVAWDRYRVLTDHAGSVRAVVGVGGVVVQRMSYTAFGAVREDWHASGWDPLPFGYAGGLYDRATGLVRYGARVYDPGVGRWLSRDPIGFNGGDSNVYAYCQNDPVNHIDPSGLAADANDLARWVPGANLFAVGARRRANGIFMFGAEDTVDRAQCVMNRGALEIGFGAFVAADFSVLAAGGAELVARSLALAERAAQIHSALHPFARNQRTTAVLQTTGEVLVGGGARDIYPAQRAVLTSGEIETRLPGEHAEITVLKGAESRNEAPVAIGVSRPFCPDCEREILESGGVLTSPTSATWPR